MVACDVLRMCRTDFTQYGAVEGGARNTPLWLSGSSSNSRPSHVVRDFSAVSGVANYLQRPPLPDHDPEDGASSGWRASMNGRDGPL